MLRGLMPLCFICPRLKGVLDVSLIGTGRVTKKKKKRKRPSRAPTVHVPI